MKKVISTKKAPQAIGPYSQAIEVNNVMTQKKDVVILNIDDDLKTNILKIKESKYSRFPVYQKDKNNIIGIINVKDIIFEHKESQKLDLNKSKNVFIRII